jgi:hypothetical protein
MSWRRGSVTSPGSVRFITKGKSLIMCTLSANSSGPFGSLCLDETGGDVVAVVHSSRPVLFWLGVPRGRVPPRVVCLDRAIRLLRSSSVSSTGPYSEVRFGASHTLHENEVLTRTTYHMGRSTGSLTSSPEINAKSRRESFFHHRNESTGVAERNLRLIDP